MNIRTRDRYDAFVREYHVNGGNGAKAAISAGYSEHSARQTATRLLTIDYVAKELDRLKAKANEDYTITLERRIRWLETAVQAGLKTYVDSQGNQRPDNLSATINGVKELNAMLGDSTEKEEPKPLSISFSVNDAVGDVKVTNADT